MTLVPLPATIADVLPPVRPAPLERLPGSPDDDPFLRLAAAWLVGHQKNTAIAYRRDLQAWAAWCAGLDVHPLAAERHHVDLWVRHLTGTPQPSTGRPASPVPLAPGRGGDGAVRVSLNAGPLQLGHGRSPSSGLDQSERLGRRFPDRGLAAWCHLLQRPAASRIDGSGSGLKPGLPATNLSRSTAIAPRF